VLGLLSLYLLPCLLVASDVRPGEAGIDWFAPAQDQEVRGSLPLVEVAGRVASPSRAPLDMVIALDVSDSVFLPTARDVDGDGVIGRLRVRGPRRPDGSARPAVGWTTDPGDTVFEAERASARRLLESLRRDSVRVGLLTFAERARVRAGLGAPEQALAALAALRSPDEPGSTDLSRALHAGQRMLRAAPGENRRRTLVLLSDGHATRPGPPLRAGAAMRREAWRAARQGIEIHPVAVGPNAAGAASAYASLAAADRSHPLAPDPERLTASLRGSEALFWADVRIANETTGDRARALRLHPDGSFDGFVRLIPGPNRISVEVHAPDGARLRRVRTVRFTAGGLTPDDLALTRGLRLRTLQIDRASFAASGGRRPHRLLELNPER